MRLSKSWTIAAKDFKTYRRKRNIIYSLVVIPVFIAVLLSLLMEYAGHRAGQNGIPAAELVVLLPAFAFFYVILAAYVPTAISSYTIVGEKLEKSLEPLLATPTTDSEILFGKAAAAFLPPLAAVWGGSVIFMILMDLVTKSRLGYDYFPNWNTAVVLLFLVPVAAALSVEINVIISSRISDVRTAQQFGILAIAPFAGLYLCGELNIVDLGNMNNLLIIAGAVLVVDVLFFFLARATFRREEILTKWK